MNFKKLVLLFGTITLFSTFSFVQAQEDDDDGADVLETIVVTATRRETDIMDTPVPVSALSDAELTKNGLNNIDDLSYALPGLSIQNTDGNSPIITLRGVRSNNVTELGDPAIGIHVDGVYAARPQAAAALMFDLERAELLRGPQGTLFGRNSIVGSLNIVTAKPNFDVAGGRLGVDAGRFNERVIRGHYNMPISDNFAIRIAFSDVQKDSYLDGYWDGSQGGDYRYLPEEISSQFQPTDERTTSSDYAWFWGCQSYQAGNEIVSQLKKLGSSCDWSKERFTMDKGLSSAVTKVFVDLYNKKLIYKDVKLVNWDPVLQTAVSDLEVVQKDIEGKLYYINYSIINSDEYVTIATTRPETMFGDSALAVNPKDKRYKHLVGKKALIPILNREIVIIEDIYADPEQGSGVVKITPAHDFNDFLVGERNNLEKINIFSKDAKLNNNVPNSYIGLDRFVARTKLVDELTGLNKLDKVENIKHAVPYGDRSDAVIEPYLTEQWFLNAKHLAKDAITNVKNKTTSFFPENWTKTYFQWMNNIQPWCISRQL